MEHMNQFEPNLYHSKKSFTGQQYPDISDIFRMVLFRNKSHVLHDTTENTTCKITEGLFDVVVPVILLSLWIVSKLRREMHSGENIRHFLDSSVYYISYPDDAEIENQVFSKII